MPLLKPSYSLTTNLTIYNPHALGLYKRLHCINIYLALLKKSLLKCVERQFQNERTNKLYIIEVA